MYFFLSWCMTLFIPAQTHVLAVAMQCHVNNVEAEFFMTTISWLWLKSCSFPSFGCGYLFPSEKTVRNKDWFCTFLKEPITILALWWRIELIHTLGTEERNDKGFRRRQRFSYLLPSHKARIVQITKFAYRMKVMVHSLLLLLFQMS